jgi:hypothetical protein
LAVLPRRINFSKPMYVQLVKEESGDVIHHAFELFDLPNRGVWKGD